MPAEGKTENRAIERMTESIKAASDKGPPPVHLWNPPDCGEIDIRIGADGTWYYQKTPIGRPGLVRLFASILRREGNRYYLVTPVEKCAIAVDDAPFMAVEMRDHGAGVARRLTFRTNVDDWVECGPGHPLRFELQACSGGLKPYLHVRRDLWAKVTRALSFDLAALGETRSVGGAAMFGVASGGEFYSMARAEDLEAVGR